jgi:hypothetical protein
MSERKANTNCKFTQFEVHLGSIMALGVGQAGLRRAYGNKSS